MKHRYLNRGEILNIARRAQSAPEIIDQWYERAIAELPGEGDTMADAMAIEAVYLKLEKRTTTPPDWCDDCFDAGERVDWVRIATGETVPVFTPEDDSPIYAEW